MAKYRTKGGIHQDAKGEFLAIGTPYDPSEAELKAFPDRFELIGAAEPSGPVEVTPPDKSVDFLRAGDAVEALRQITDAAALKAFMKGEDRPTVQSAASEHLQTLGN